MKNHISHASCLLIGFACLICGPVAHAEKSDRSKPVNVEADSVNVDDARKSAIYEGNVQLSQGTLMIRADRIEVQQDDKGVVSGLASGKPAYFRQKMEASNEYAEGWANAIEYDGHSEKLKLIGQPGSQAKLKRGIDELRGNQIIYESSTEQFQAKGGEGGSSGRVRAVIRPRNTTDSTPAAPATKP